MCSSDDGYFLASADVSGVTIWDVRSCQSIRTLHFDGSIESLSLSGDGGFVCAAGTTVDGNKQRVSRVGL